MQHIENSEMSATLSAMEDLPVLVIGDIMLDRFVYGTVERISPESPVPVLSVLREDKMLGGAGNALASLAGLKCKGHIIAVIGEDSEGQILASELRAIGIASDGLVIDSSRPTTLKTRFLAGHQQLLRSDFENNQTICGRIESEILEKAELLMPKMRGVLISDYGKGVLSARVLNTLITMARHHNIPVVVDPKGKDYLRYHGATAVTPNKKELAEASAGSPVKTDAQIVKAARLVLDECDIGCVLATRSAEGMSVICKDEAFEPVHLRTTAKDVYDVSGAGDVVIATFTAALSTGANMICAAALSNLAGGIAVSKVGTAPIRAKELHAALADIGSLTTLTPVSTAHNPNRHLQAPLCDDDEALEQIRRWRARGFKIGFTNGCFDILHHGHVSYLNEARSHCDRLVVGLNTDASVKILKGAARPVNDETSRASVLGALASVDMVVLFGAALKGEDQTANALIARLQPDIYFKGGDYKVEQIPEAAGVQSYGGSVKVLSVFEGHSTTGTIAKIKPAA